MYHSTLSSLTKLSVYLFLSLVFTEYSNCLNDVTTHTNWCLVNPDNCGTSLTGRIIGGMDAKLGQYPWMARIGYTSKKYPEDGVIFRCGGVLINKRYVVTAAHCAHEGLPDLDITTVRLGEYNMSTNPDCSSAQLCAEPFQEFTVTPKQIIIHKNHDMPSLLNNDIAMIRLDHDALFNGWVAPICLPYSTLLTKNYIGENAEMAGWGIMTRADSFLKKFNQYVDETLVLKTVSIPIVAMSQCEAKYQKQTNLSDSQICAYENGKDSCTGDSGGPLMKVEVLNGPPKYFFIGIISFGDQICGDTPTVCTRVASFMDWILDNMEP